MRASILESLKKNAVLIPVSLALLLYLRTLFFGYVFDDPRTFDGIEYALREGTLWRVWIEPYWKTLGRFDNLFYRPAYVYSLLPDLYLGRLPWFSHFLSVSFHIANIGLAYLFFSRLNVSKPALISALSVWAIHPINNETVTSVSVRASLLLFLFFMIALLLLKSFQANRRRTSYLLSLAAACLSVGMRENGIALFVLAPVLLFYGQSAGLKTWIRYSAPYLVFILSFLLWFGYIYGTYKIAELDAMGGTSFHFFYVAMVPVELFQRFLFPWLLKMDYPPFEKVWGNSSIIYDTVSAIVLLAASLFLLVKLLKKHLLAFVVLLMLLPLTPLMAFSHTLPSLADRYFYTASLGLSLSIFLVLENNPQKKVKVSVRALCGLAVFLFFVTSWVRIDNWKNDEVLYQSMIESYEKSFNGHMGLAPLYANKGHFNLAEEHFLDALQLDPRNRETLCQLSLMYSEWGKPKKAFSRLRQAEQYHGEHPKVLKACAKIATIHRQRKKAKQCIERLKKSGEHSNFLNMIEAIQLFLDGNHQEAKRLLKTSLLHSPHDKDLFWVAAANLRALGENQEALLIMQRLYRIWPNPMVMNDIALLYLQIGKPETAQQYLQAAIRRYPEEKVLQENLRVIRSRTPALKLRKDSRTK